MGREGFPYVGLEAMAVGTPVVGYEHGGLPEMLGDCGLLVSPGDRNALGEAILHLLGTRPSATGWRAAVVSGCRSSSRWQEWSRR